MIVKQEGITPDQRKDIRDRTEESYRQIFGHAKPLEEITLLEVYHMLSLQNDLMYQAFAQNIKALVDQAFTAGLEQGIRRAMAKAGALGSRIVMPNAPGR